MKIRRSTFLTAGLVLLTACGKDPTPNEAPPVRDFRVPTVIVPVREVPLIYTTTGSVVSDERVEISSRTAAYVRSINVREGERVQLKQLLATLDSQDIDANIRVARANRDQAAAAKADAQRDVDDSNKLFAKGMVAEVYLRKGQVQLQSANEHLEAAEAVLARAQAERQYTSILSPVAGVVIARHQRAGDLASPGTALVTVESDTALLFETHVAEQRVTEIRTGDSVQVTIDALKQTLNGEVLRLVSSGDPMTRGFQVKISLPATTGLLPGMFGRAKFKVGGRKAVVIPASSLVDRGGLSGVYVVDTEQRLHFRWLRTEHPVDDGIVVLAGLDQGERIVVTPTSKMREGDRLAPKSGK